MSPLQEQKKERIRAAARLIALSHDQFAQLDAHNPSIFRA